MRLELLPFYCSQFNDNRLALKRSLFFSLCPICIVVLHVNAIKNEKFIVVPSRYMFSGIYTVDAFEMIVEGLEK